MGTKKEIKKIKQPDAFQDRLLASFDWLSSYRSQALKLGALLAIALVATVVWRYWEKQQYNKSVRSLGLIDEQLFRQQRGLQEKQLDQYKEMSELMTAMGKLDSKAKDYKTKKSQWEEKLQEMQKGLQEEPSFHEVANSYESFARENISNVLGLRAGVQAAQLMIKMKDFKKARTILEEVLAKAPKTLDFYQVQVRAMYISLLDELGEADKALSEAKLLTQGAPEYLKSSALFVQGRALMHNNKSDDAKKVFHQIMKEHSGSKEASRARAFYNLIK